MSSNNLSKIFILGIHSIEDVHLYLNKFDWYEEYHASETYSEKPIAYTKQGITRDYEPHIVNINGRDFVVYVEIITKKELETLKKVCQCLYCRTSFLNPLKYMTCPHCKGCLRFTEDYKPCASVLKKTRDFFYK